ncbi:MAG: phosphopantetheine-protein transferase [Legionella sp. 40-6]|nr:4'-phosphopantetheinyl transferase superfamily protein [Legionella sp.]OJX95942.1 MAG: phosphopantetheine-protein transferase [Legionella sp. 40-6]
MIISGFNALDPDHCVLSETRIDLWQFSLTQELPDAAQILNAEEQARVERFYFSKHQRRFATARTTLRIILSRYLNLPPHALEFSYNNHGKPKVLNALRLQFNLSHTEDLAVLAVGKGFPLGVDIEKYSARPYAGIAKNLFSAQEYEDFVNTPPPLKPAVFFHIWSQKEAFIKACGLGLSYPTRDFTVPTAIPTKQLVKDPLHNMTWQLRSFMPAIGYSGALCYHPTIRDIRHGFIQLQSTKKSELEF